MQTVIQIGAAVGFQIVDGVQNSGITRVGGNVLPSRSFYGCAFTETDQRNIAAGAVVGSIAIKEIDGRNLGGSQTVVTTAATCVVRVIRQAAIEGGFVIRLIDFNTCTAAIVMLIDTIFI